MTWQASSEHEAADILRTLGSLNPRIQIAVAIDLPDTAPRQLSPFAHRKPGEPLRVVFLSRISPMKNLDYALEVLAQVTTPIVFTIYGPREDATYWNRCEAAIAALPPHVSVIEAGPLHPSRVVETLAQHDLFLLPTKGENYGHVIAEALKAGLRLLISDRTPWRGLEAKKVGYDLPLEDPAAFVAAIETEAQTQPDIAEKNRTTGAEYLAQILRTEDTLSANRQLFFRPIPYDHKWNIHNMGTEDYISKSTYFKIRKVVRYIELYGVSRTLVKVKSQLHMKAAQDFDGPVWQNQNCMTPDEASRSVAVIGCGSFAFGVIGYYLAKRNRRFLRAALDVSAPRARSFVEQYGGAYATIEVDRILADPKVRLVYVASNHASHAEYAIAAIRAGKHVHIEKPHVVSTDQLDRLWAAMQENPKTKVYLGFNRPRSTLFKKLEKLLAAETGPSMINWFIAGHKIEDNHWYFSPQEGGRILGNLCHWTDLTLEIIPSKERWPINIHAESPSNSKSDFVTTIAFGDGSIAAITFSAKGHTFDGVREFLNVHRGDLLAELKDFKSLAISHDTKRKIWKGIFRDHGHRANVMNSYDGVFSDIGQEAAERAYILDTARLFLAVKEAHETGKLVTLQRDERGQVGA